MEREGVSIIFWEKRQWNCIDFLRGTWFITAMFEGLQEISDGALLVYMGHIQIGKEHIFGMN